MAAFETIFYIICCLVVGYFVFMFKERQDATKAGKPLPSYLFWQNQNTTQPQQTNQQQDIELEKLKLKKEILELEKKK